MKMKRSRGELLSIDMVIQGVSFKIIKVGSSPVLSPYPNPGFVFAVKYLSKS